MAWSISRSQTFIFCTIFALLTSLVAQAAIVSGPYGEADSLPAVDVSSEPSSLGHGPVHTRKLLSPPTYQQQVEDAVLKTFNYLIGSNSGARNPLAALDVPCQEFQLKGELKDGPYYLTAVFQFTFPSPDLPIPARTCKLKPGIPVLVTVGDVICTALCSARTGKCDCCDGSVNTADPADPSNTAVCPVTTRTDCSYCEDAKNLGFFSDYQNSQGSSATLTDLSTGATTPLQLASVSVPGHPIQLTPNSYYHSPGGGVTYGPDAVMIGPPLYVGQFALIDPALLLPGHTYRVATTFPGYNNGHPVVYEIQMHKN